MKIEHKKERWVRWRCPFCGGKQNDCWDNHGGPSYELICGWCDKIVKHTDLPPDIVKDWNWALEICE